jgi:hypothetical protein
MEKRSIIKQLPIIRRELGKRFEELGLSYTQITKEAQKFEQTNINVSTLSRYFDGQSKNSLTEESIIYLCHRYGIIIKINVVTVPYNEEECIEKTLKIFGKEDKLKKVLNDGI